MPAPPPSLLTFIQPSLFRSSPTLPLTSTSFLVSPSHIPHRHAGTPHRIPRVRPCVATLAEARSTSSSTSSATTSTAHVRNVPQLACDPAQPPSSPVPGMPDWRFIGPPLSAGPLPAVIYLALTSSQSLDLAPFNALARATLARRPHAVRVFSVTLPMHLPDMDINQTVFHDWARTYRAGGDVVSSFTRRATLALDHLIAARHVDADRLVLAGLSRGGLLAALLAASTALRVRACLLLAPVSVLGELHELAPHVVADQRANLKIARASLLRDDVIDALVDVNVRVYMGNSDTRVGTRNAFEFAHALAERAAALGSRSPPHEFYMYSSVGKHGHGTPPDVFQAGADYLVSHMDDTHSRPRISPRTAAATTQQVL